MMENYQSEHHGTQSNQNEIKQNGSHDIYFTSSSDLSLDEDNTNPIDGTFRSNQFSEALEKRKSEILSPLIKVTSTEFLNEGTSSNDTPNGLHQQSQTILEELRFQHSLIAEERRQLNKEKRHIMKERKQILDERRMLAEERKQFNELTKQLTKKMSRYERGIREIEQTKDYLKNLAEQLHKRRLIDEVPSFSSFRSSNNKPASTNVGLSMTKSFSDDNIVQLGESVSNVRLANARVNSSASTALIKTDKIKLNIGGTVFMTSLSTITKTRSMLSSMFSGFFDTRADENGEHFIDRDPEWFPTILHYLRRGSIDLSKYSNSVLADELAEEAAFYGLFDLEQLIQEELQDRVRDLSWMETRDKCDGFRAFSFEPRIRFAVSQSNIWNPEMRFHCPKGYHWATTDEYLSLVDGVNVHEAPYYNQGGWIRFTFNGVERGLFAFKDTAVTKKWKEVANINPSSLSIIEEVKTKDRNSHHTFAGIVCIADSPEVAKYNSDYIIDAPFEK